MPLATENYKGLTLVSAPGSGLAFIQDALRRLAERNPTVNFEAVVPPSIFNDSEDTAVTGTGYYIGSKWYDQSTGRMYLCVDDTPGAAEWVAFADLTTVESFANFAGDAHTYTALQTFTAGIVADDIETARLDVTGTAMLHEAEIGALSVTASVLATALNATTTPLTVRGYAGQSVPLFAVQNAALVAVFGIGATGQLRTNQTIGSVSGVSGLTAVLPLYDAAGTLVGYVPLYTTFTSE